MFSVITPTALLPASKTLSIWSFAAGRYTVQIGKTPDGEIDFVAVRQNEKLYVQVTQQINSISTEKREYERLLEIHDNYPKYVLTTDAFAGGNYEGIKTMHIADFLLSSEY